MTTELLFLPLGVVAGALTQRVTGIGFALVCAPLLVLIAGPFEGVVLSNLLGLTVSVDRLRRRTGGTPSGRRACCWRSRR